MKQKNNDSQVFWESFHWVFFINVQGLIISMLRFEKFIAVEDFELAKVELNTAVDLMLAAAASMELAGNFTREEYEFYVRPTMIPPKVNSDDFSGLMSWDHAYLMKIWKRVQPKFKSMPLTLKSEQEKFVSAYMTLSKSHKKVCSKFGGTELGSLRSKNITAIEVLEKFEHNRKQLIE